MYAPTRDHLELAFWSLIVTAADTAIFPHQNQIGSRVIWFSLDQHFPTH